MYGAQFHLILVGSDLLTLCSCYFTNLVPKVIARYSWELPRSTNLLCLIDSWFSRDFPSIVLFGVFRRNLYLLILCNVSVDLSSTSNNGTTTTIFNLLNIHFTIATRYHLLPRLRTHKHFWAVSWHHRLIAVNSNKSSRGFWFQAVTQ